MGSSVVVGVFEIRTDLVPPTPILLPSTTEKHDTQQKAN